MKAPYSMIPTLPLFIGVSVGIVLSMCGLHLIWSVIPLIAGIALYLTKQHYLAFTIISVCLGWCNYALRAPAQPDKELLDQKSTFTGIVDRVNQGEDSRMLIVDVIKSSQATHHYKPFKCMFMIHTLRPTINEGDTVSCYGKISELSTRTDVPNEFSYAKYLTRIGVTAQANVDADSIKIIGTSTSLFYRLKRLRSDISQLLYQSKLNDNASQFMATTILGDTSLLTTDTREQFATAGLAHILALSGLHVGIITLLLSIMLFPLRIFSRFGRYNNLIIIACLWFYALLTGLSLSVTRAVIMATMLLLAATLQRRNNSYNALFIAAIIIMIANPLAIIQPGFQLSFCAVFAIITFNDKINPVNPRRTVLYNTVLPFTVSLSAMLGTALISAYHFHQIPPYCIIANVAVSWLLPIIVGLGVLMIALLTLGIDWGLLADTINFLHKILESITQFIANIPGASIYIKDFSPVTFVIYALFLIALYFSLKQTKVIRWATTALLAATTCLFIANSGYKPPKCEIFIPADTKFTNLLLHDNDKIYIIATAEDAKRQAIVDKYSKKYDDYMHTLGVTSLTFINQNDICNNSFSRFGNNVLIKDTRFAFINEQNDINKIAPKPDYLIVTGSFKGDIIDAVNNIQPDSVILSREINPIRCRQIEYTLRLHNIKFSSIFLNKFHKIIDK